VSETDAQKPSGPERWLRFLPLAIFLALAGLFLARLFAGDASRLPSVLIGRPAPAFTLPALAGAPGDVPGLAAEDLRHGGVSVVNFFASWCAPCRAEHRALMTLATDPALKAKGVKLYGVAYKDEPENSRKFLAEGGNPFARIGVDASGRAAIDFGVYGVPETYVIRGDGIVAFKFVGPLSQQALATVLTPEIEKAARAQTP
jgi:cytochrome c biogenesis protein CcmG, thiol:disulfide interchange protein DsbE